jgi:hypothetical protein
VALSGGSLTDSGTLTASNGVTVSGGSLTDSGTLTTTSNGVTLSGGSSLFGGGTITGNLDSTDGTVTPGASATKTGKLTDTGTYTQGSGSTLDIGIAGSTGTKFDVLKATTAVLGGTLNISDLNGFIPTVGSTFKILTFNSVTGTFATVNGLTINGTEEYTITYQAKDVLLTVVTTPAPTSPRLDERIDDRFSIGSNEGSRLTAALQQINAEYAIGASLTGRNEGMAPRPRLERIRAMDLIKKGAKQ